MTDCHLIVFLDTQNLGIDNQNRFLKWHGSKNYWIFDISEIMLIYANQVNYENAQ